MQQIYLSYTCLEGVAPWFRLIEDKATYQLMGVSAKRMGYVVSQLHQDSTRESDPLISVLAITEQRLQAGEPESISQDAINWLVDNGHLTLPPEAFQ